MRAKINLRPYGSYTIIENAGLGTKGMHTATVNWLEAHRHLFDTVRVSPVATAHAIKVTRVPAFIAYCRQQEVEIGKAAA
jgi:hypothetical protein